MPFADTCFNSRPSCDGRLEVPLQKDLTLWFQFTPVMRRATRSGCGLVLSGTFQFTPVMRRATRRTGPCAASRRFNSRPSCDGRLSTYQQSTTWKGFNSRPSCDGRRRHRHHNDSRRVSIHARHATGDPAAGQYRFAVLVSIHARHATGDSALRSLAALTAFQFTPVMRRATSRNHRADICRRFQFTPVMRRATRQLL